ncbi:DUF1499 domain-containing protein [Myxococcota bacterium]|nr:DUF1499 domain-containing protein [Myxococcota bacterium]
MATRSTVAVASAGVGGFSVLAAVLGPVMIHLGLLAPLQGFMLFSAGAGLGGLLALVLGMIGLIRTRATSGREGRGQALLGVGAGVVLLLVLGRGMADGGAAPPIHDITTDLDDPPVFSDAVRNATDRQNGVDYPDGGSNVPDQQRAGYPGFGPISVDAPPSQALERARDAAKRLGWTVTWVDIEQGRMEAYDVTPVFQFVDDVAIRVRPAEAGSRVDARSNSRVGGGDLGANAARIDALRAQLQNSR